MDFGGTQGWGGPQNGRGGTQNRESLGGGPQNWSVPKMGEIPKIGGPLEGIPKMGGPLGGVPKMEGSPKWGVVPKMGMVLEWGGSPK